MLSLYGKTKGIVFGKDVTVVQAGPPLVRTQLAGRPRRGGMTWEPSATLTMRDNPQYRTILNGDAGVEIDRQVDGWVLIVGMREDFLEKNAAGCPG